MGSGRHLPTMIKPNPANSSDINQFTIVDFPMWAFVETADFRSMSMSRTGQILIYNNYGPYFVIDQDISLKTGRLSVVEYKSTGHVNFVALRRPYYLKTLTNYVFGLGFGVERIAEENIGGREHYENVP